MAARQRVLIYSCYVHCRRPRVVCPRCGVQQAEAPFARKNSRNTLLFEGLVMLIAHDTPFSSVARLMGCNEKTAVRIVSYWVNESRRRQSLEKLSSLAVDETSMRRGHVYVTLFVDAENRSVAHVEPGRDGTAVENFAKVLSCKGGSPEGVAWWASITAIVLFIPWFAVYMRIVASGVFPSQILNLR